MIDVRTLSIYKNPVFSGNQYEIQHNQDTFLVLGYYDKVVIEHHNFLTKRNTICSALQCMNKVEEKENCQTVNIWADEDYSKFWLEENQKSVLFLSFLHCNELNIEQVKHDVREKLEYFNYAIYYSLDSSELTVLVKNDSYVTLLKKTIDFQSIKNMKYSYTISCISSLELNGSRNFWCDQLQEITFNIMLGETGRVSELFTAFCRSLKAKKSSLHFRTGSDDVYFTFRTVHSKNLKKLLIDLSSGILPCGRENNPSPISDDPICKNCNERNVACGTIPLFMLRTCIGLKGYKIISSTNNKSDKNTQSEQDEESLTNCYKDLSKLLKKYNLQDDYSMKALLRLFKAISSNEFFDYGGSIKKIIEKPINTLINILKEYNESYLSIVDLKMGMDELTKALFSVMHDSMHTHRQFLHTIGLNTFIIDTPAKLGAFYANYIHSLSNSLWEGEYGSTNNRSFSFLICAEIASSISSIEILRPHDRKNAIHLLKVPHKDLFDINKMLIIITHECAHYVGKKSRMHFNRHDSILQIAARCFCYDTIERTEWETYEIIAYVKNSFSEIYYNTFIDMYPEIYEKLHYLNATGEDPGKYNSQGIGISREEFYYSLYAQDCIKNMIDIFGSTSTYMDTFATLVEKGYFLTKRSNNNEDFSSFTNIPKIINVHRNLNVNKIKDLAISYFAILREGYADLVMIFTLGISLETYLDIMWNELGGLDKDTFEEKRIIIVFASVFMYQKELFHSLEPAPNWCIGNIGNKSKYNSIIERMSMYKDLRILDKNASISKQKKPMCTAETVCMHVISNYFDSCIPEIAHNYINVQQKYSKLYRALVIDDDSSMSVSNFLKT